MADLPTTPGTGQLTYSAGADGYQVLARQGDISPDQERAHIARVPVNTRFGVAIPEFPTPSQVASLPRRFMYLADQDHATLWHVAPAGSDASGRPDNVFAHIVQVPLSSESAGRPIDRWRAPEWLSPFGATEVARAELPAQPPGPGESVSRERTVEFLTDPKAWRLGFFPLLLDAVSGAVGRRHIVLGVESQDSAAQWIAAVSYLMAPATAARWSWSLWETPESVGRAAELGASLCCVPREVLADVPELPDRLILDELAPADIGEVGGTPHRLADGMCVSATEWSALASAVFSLADDPVQVLGEIDGVGRDALPAVPPYAWPLAIVVGRRRDEIDGLDDAVRNVVLTQTPDGLPDDTGLVETAVSIVRQGPELDTADLWRDLESQTHLESPIARLVSSLYVRSALRDRAWLMGPTPAPHLLRPDRPQLTARENEALRETVLDLLIEARYAAAQPGSEIRGQDHALYVLRLLDFAYREGFTLETQEARDELAQHLDETLPEFPQPEDLWRRVGPLNDRLLRDLIRPRLSNVSGMAAESWPERLEERVLGCLYPHGTSRLAQTDRGPVALDVRAILRFGVDPREAGQIEPWALQALSEPEPLLTDAFSVRRYVSTVYGRRGLRGQDVLDLEADGFRLPTSLTIQALMTADVIDERWTSALATTRRRMVDAQPGSRWPDMNRALRLIGEFEGGRLWSPDDARIVLVGTQAYLSGEGDLTGHLAPAGLVRDLVALADALQALSLLQTGDQADVETPGVDRFLGERQGPPLLVTPVRDYVTRLDDSRQRAEFVTRMTALASVGDSAVRPAISSRSRPRRVATRRGAGGARYLEGALRAVWGFGAPGTATPEQAVEEARRSGEDVLSTVHLLSGGRIVGSDDVKRFEQSFSAWLDHLTGTKGVLGRRRTIFGR